MKQRVTSDPRSVPPIHWDVLLVVLAVCIAAVFSVQFFGGL
jgi:hypothetical protein